MDHKDQERIGWNETYQRLVAYKEEHSNTNVPAIYKEDPRLGTWVRYQRLVYKNKNNKLLSEERCTLLDFIGFEWQLKNGRKKNNTWMESKP